jgi:hypothetical protein
MPKSRVCPEILIQQIGRVPIVVTHKLPTDWSRFIDHRKAERVTYRNGIRDFENFGHSENQKLSSVQPLFYVKPEFSSDVDSQNSVTSKPLSGQKCMSNG